MRSESINELAEALSKAQSEIQDAEKNAKNPHFKSGYADLSAVLQATREPLSKNGLSVSQLTFSEGDDYYLETTLLHKSGQWIGSRLKLLLMKKDMQGLGGAITYARRYSLAAIVGIAQEDADGEPTKITTKQYEPKKIIDETVIETQKIKEQQENEEKKAKFKQEQELIADRDLRIKLFKQLEVLCKKQNQNVVAYIHSKYPNDGGPEKISANKYNFLIKELIGEENGK